MKTIVIANQKGGSGKSTLTVHLAAAAEYAGDSPAIITDTDPQGSAGDWFNQRKKAGIDTPRYAPLALAELDSKLKALEAAGAAYLFIDTARGEYAGALELSFNGIGVKAIAILSTKMPDGSKGWSLLLLVYSQFLPMQLSWGFTLNGIGGLVGVQHGLNIEELRGGMRTGFPVTGSSATKVR